MVLSHIDNDAVKALVDGVCARWKQFAVLAPGDTFQHPNTTVTHLAYWLLTLSNVPMYLILYDF